MELAKMRRGPANASSFARFRFARKHRQSGGRTAGRASAIRVWWQAAASLQAPLQNRWGRQYRQLQGQAELVRNPTTIPWAQEVAQESMAASALSPLVEEWEEVDLSAVPVGKENGGSQ